MSKTAWKKSDGKKWEALDLRDNVRHPRYAKGIVHELWEDDTLRALAWFIRGWGWYCVQFTATLPVVRPLGDVHEFVAKGRVSRQVIEHLNPTLRAYGEKPWGHP